MHNNRRIERFVMPIVLDGTTGITYPSGAVSASGITYASGLTGATPSIGDGQTWQSFTVGSTRVSGTTYTNTTGKPIGVAIIAQVSVALSMTIDGVSLTGNATNSGTNRSWTLYIVPPNQTYVTSGTLLNWYELR